MKLDEIKTGLATAWDSMTDSVGEGWQRLRKAGNAITHFNAASQSGAGGPRRLTVPTRLATAGPADWANVSWNRPTALQNRAKG